MAYIVLIPSSIQKEEKVTQNVRLLIKNMLFAVSTRKTGGFSELILIKNEGS